MIDLSRTRDCKTCEGEGTIVFDCKERQCFSGGKGVFHEIECPCCEGEGWQEPEDSK